MFQQLTWILRNMMEYDGLDWNESTG